MFSSPFLKEEDERTRTMDLNMPSKIKDAKGKEWALKVTACSLMKACRGTGLSIQSLMNLEIDLEHILAALPFFCEAEIKDVGITHDQFLDLFGMEELTQVALAFFPAMSDAFVGAEDVPAEGGVVDASGDPLENPGPVTTS